MKIAVVGGGPGGLYFSILTKKANPDFEIDVYERNKADDSFGFGVVFSDETLSEFLTRDPESYSLIRKHFAYWDELDIARNGQKVRITGNGFCGCSRKTLLKLLHQRCREEGVKLHFESEANGHELSKTADLVVAADGIASNTRTEAKKEFGTEIKLQRNRFVWMGSTRPLDAFTYFFRQTEFGPIVAHTYQYEEGKSTWIFECSPETYAKAGFEETNETKTVAQLEQLFQAELDGHGLITNRSHWRQFPHVTNQNWNHGNIVLLGDSKATAHFSIGSGTKLAMESAIALSDGVSKHQLDLKQVFNYYESHRRNVVGMIQHAAQVSLDWFEKMDLHMSKPFNQFAFGVMTRAKKVTLENLALRDPKFTEGVMEEFLSGKDVDAQIPSPCFQPFEVNGMKLENRIVMSAMGQYQAAKGEVQDWHQIHYGSRAVGGVGLIITEMTAIAPEGRITPGCAGIYTEKQKEGWQKIVDFIHQNSNTKIAIQLGHCGPKGSVEVPWKRNQPLSKPWKLVSASGLPFDANHPAPQALDREGMDMIIREFQAAARRADEAGFDGVELQMHHGFLLGSFISPLTNQRKDVYGGTLENRMKFPLEVFQAVRKIVNNQKPVWVRISASDWADGGTSLDDAVAIAQAFTQAGSSMINVSSGGTVAHEKPVKGRMWQAHLSEWVKHKAHCTTICTGGIETVDQINTLLLNQKCDLVGMGRPLLTDPNLPRKMEAYEGVEVLPCAPNYKIAIPSFRKEIQKERQSVTAMKMALKPKSHKPS